MKPFLKWAGNKYQIWQKIVPLLQGKGKHYLEPFLGSGAIYGQLSGFDSYHLNDFNPDVANIFTWVREVPHTVVAFTKEYFHPDYNTAEMYYPMRERFNHLPQPRAGILAACMFLYLNRHCYNGLARYNHQGLYNTPLGRYKKPYFPADEIHAWSKKMREDQPKLTAMDFEEVLAPAGAGWVVYFDPPYFPTSLTASFTGYTGSWKTVTDDERLAKAARAAYDRGAHVVMSNSDTHFNRVLYADYGATITSITAPRYIAADSDKRGGVSELLITFGEPHATADTAEDGSNHSQRHPSSVSDLALAV